jgi:hypothetical protein
MDAGAAAGWAQFVAIFFTGAGALYVANRQLKAYNDALEASNRNERFRNSIDALKDFRIPMPLHGESMSPLEATTWLSSKADDPSDVARYRSYPQREKSADPSAATDEKWVRKIGGAAVIGSMYYLDLGTLMEKNLVDVDYVMTKTSGAIIMFYDAIKVFGLLHSGTEALEKLASRARLFQAGRPNERLT